jgi:hypothetical protein
MSQLLSLCIVSCLFVGMTISIQQLDSPNFEVYQILCALTSSFFSDLYYFYGRSWTTIVRSQCRSLQGTVDLQRIHHRVLLWNCDVLGVSHLSFHGLALICRFDLHRRYCSCVSSCFFLSMDAWGDGSRETTTSATYPQNEQHMQEFADIISQTLYEQMKSKDTFANLTAIKLTSLNCKEWRLGLGDVDEVLHIIERGDELVKLLYIRGYRESMSLLLRNNLKDSTFIAEGKTG